MSGLQESWASRSGNAQMTCSNRPTRLFRKEPFSFPPVEGEGDPSMRQAFSGNEPTALRDRDSHLSVAGQGPEQRTEAQEGSGTAGQQAHARPQAHAHASALGTCSQGQFTVALETYGFKTQRKVHSHSHLLGPEDLLPTAWWRPASRRRGVLLRDPPAAL